MDVIVVMPRMSLGSAFQTVHHAEQKKQLWSVRTPPIGNRRMEGKAASTWMGVVQEPG